MRSPRHPSSLLLTIDEAAGALGIGRTKVYELIRDGQLHTVSIGRCRRVSIAGLERFVERLELIHPGPNLASPSPDVDGDERGALGVTKDPRDGSH